MNRIFVNLKRFDVPKDLGGVCPLGQPDEWIEGVIAQCVQLGMGNRDNLQVTFLLPEGLILAALRQLHSYPLEQTRGISIGCQGVYRKNVAKGGNFGAFTTHLPAAAAKNLGCTWAIVGHSEERKDKLELMHRLERWVKDPKLALWAEDVVDQVIGEEVSSALEAGIDVLLCVGESAAQRGDGTFSEQQPRIETVLRQQLACGLQGITELLPGRQVVIGYEPLWAIGPGKTPPGREYIAWVSQIIKEVVLDEYGYDVPVVYGGGLKEENAEMIGGIETINGGLVALTRFTGAIGFEPEGLNAIIRRFMAGRR